MGRPRVARMILLMRRIELRMSVCMVLTVTGPLVMGILMLLGYRLMEALMLAAYFHLLSSIVAVASVAGIIVIPTAAVVPVRMMGRGWNRPTDKQ